MGTVERLDLAAEVVLLQCGRLQIVSDAAHVFRDPVRTVGDTMASLSDLTMRCDHDQHVLTPCGCPGTSDLLGA